MSQFPKGVRREVSALDVDLPDLPLCSVGVAPGRLTGAPRLAPGAGGLRGLATPPELRRRSPDSSRAAPGAGAAAERAQRAVLQAQRKLFEARRKLESNVAAKRADLSRA